MTAELTSLTAKMDALRAKGFSDEDINTLLSPVAVAAQPNPLPLSENDKAYAEQWNENIEETARTSWKVFFFGILAIIITIWPLLFGGVENVEFAIQWGFVCIVISFIGITYIGYKQEQRVKFFFKKRVD
ncbi:hypothetical protein [Aliivibrio wodanis]|uniref:hypothetical protein n=1 Tax=Aliivibrio wodanis TaxID=80852 RepID=UPI00406C2BB8